MRKFDTGATRDTDENKLDFEGFLSPLVMNRYAEYMSKHRKQADGKLRDSDNWQKGIPKAAYMKSGFRHFFDWWVNHREIASLTKDTIEESLCALMFNVMGYLHEYLKGQDILNAKFSKVGTPLVHDCDDCNIIGRFHCPPCAESHKAPAGTFKERLDKAEPGEAVKTDGPADIEHSRHYYPRNEECPDKVEPADQKIGKPLRVTSKLFDETMKKHNIT